MGQNIAEELEKMFAPDEEGEEETGTEEGAEEGGEPEGNSEGTSEGNGVSGTEIPTIITAEEQGIVAKEIIRIDLQIEALEKESVDTDGFYANIDEHLSEAEQQLEFEDKPKYMKLVAEKLKEYVSSHSKADEIEQLKSNKAELEAISERQRAIIEVTAKHPDFNYEKIHTFFDKKLSKEEQEAIYAASKSYAEVYENTYKKYIELHPVNVRKTPSPDIPNVNKTRRQSVTPQQVTEGAMSDDQKLKAALGLK